MYQAIDQAAHKLERQAGPLPGPAPPAPGAARGRPRRPRPGALEPGRGGEGEPRIVKSKRFEMKPMSPEDAALQMDLLHHDFYVFRSADSGALNVVYRRRDGDYGLIAPED